MRHSMWGRAFSAVMGVWLMLSLAEPPLMRECLVHDGYMATRSSRANPSMPRVVHHTHDMQDRADGSTPRPAGNEHGDKHNCSCLGDCCCTPAAGLAAPVVWIATTAASVVLDAGLPEYQYVPVVAAHVLPFQNGPPTIG